MTFKLDHHNKILAILNSLDDKILKKGSAYFGGGTLLALNFDEYRWSRDDVGLAATERVFNEQPDIFLNFDL